MHYGGEKPWVIVEVNHHLFALSAAWMRQLMLLPEVTAVPELPEYVRGVICVRGQVLPLVDLRRRVGMATVREEIDAFCDLMNARENDHRHWLSELQASIHSRQPFRLATDPHQCAFGKWYDGYRPPDPWLGGLLKKLDVPHQRIHRLAAQVRALQDQGVPEQAESLLNLTGAKLLGTMVRVFEDIRTLVRSSRRETVAILTASSRSLAVTVDLAVAVERLTIEELPASARTGSDRMIQRLGRRPRDQGIALIVEPDEILGLAGGC
jgi:purine-binding chemotaxis protein CheW